MKKNFFIKVMLSSLVMLGLGVQENKAQEKSSGSELKVVSFSEADARDLDVSNPNLINKLKKEGKAIVKLFMPGEVKTTSPSSTEKLEKVRDTSGRDVYKLHLVAGDSKLSIVTGKNQKILIDFTAKEWGEIIKQRIPGKKNGGLQAGKIYHVVFRDPTPVLINTQLKGAYACIDGRENLFYADDNGMIELKNLDYGEHEVEIFAKGDPIRRGILTVKDDERYYELDARRKRTITIYTVPAGGRISIVDGETTEEYKPTKEYVYGVYKVIADIDGNIVEENITVDGNKGKFPINNTRTYNITPMYQGSNVNATVFENNKKLEADDDAGVVLSGNTYQIKRPIGRSYKYYATYAGGKSPKTRVKVSMTSKSDYQLSIAARNSFVWPWEREYDAAPLAGVLGYVRKQMVTTGEGMKLKGNGVWPDGEGKWLHGIQVGFYAQPCFSWGLGLHTGLIYEAYLSSTEPSDGYYDSFQEHNITIPVHALYRLPLGRKCAVKLHGGLGFTYAVYGALSADGYEDYTDFYGTEGAPKRFNMALEGGLDFRLGPVQVGIQYSKGLTDHGSYSSEGDYKTTCNKIGINIAWVMGVD